jgi:hypothetical protein
MANRDEIPREWIHGSKNYVAQKCCAPKDISLGTVEPPRHSRKHFLDPQAFWWKIHPTYFRNGMILCKCKSPS